MLLLLSVGQNIYVEKGETINVFDEMPFVDQSVEPKLPTAPVKPPQEHVAVEYCRQLQWNHRRNTLQWNIAESQWMPCPKTQAPIDFNVTSL